ncbi:MAG: sulfotransferase [Flavobacteriales bacterium]|nr:sulfotransferase [Flavobacteriales bacterium]MBP9079010.1 sulfotransferase [Flavobacteriales bacterium]
MNPTVPTPDKEEAKTAFCPDFLVVGVVKGGTTALYNLLDRHPGIHLPPIKETNFFARADMRPGDFLREYALDVKLDVGKFIHGGMKEVVHIAQVADPAHYAALFAHARPGQVVGEVCPSYAVCPSAAKAIHAASPKSRIIFMLRDPVQRAWSQYIMNLREGKTLEQDFLKEVEQDDKRARKGWGVNHQYLALGRYAEQVERYLALFPKEQVHILLHERFKEDPMATMRHLFSTIGVAPMEAMDLSGKFNEAAVPRNALLNRLLVRSGAISTVKALVPRRLRGGFKEMLYSRKQMPTLPADQAAAVWSYYEQDVERLSRLMGVDLLQWWGPKKQQA